MYKVFVGNELFCDSRVEDLAILNPKIKLEDNVAGTFTFVIPPTHPKYSLIQKRTSIITVYRDNETEPTFEGTCVSDSVDFYNQKSVSCEGSLSFLNDSYLRPARRQGYNTRQLLSAYIAEHNAQVDSFKQFTVGAVTVQGSNLFRYTNYQSTMKEIKEDLIDDLGGHLRIRHSNGARYLDYLAESPNTNTQTIELGVNLIDFESNIDTLDLITGIIPLGNRLETSSIEGLEERLTIKSVNDNKDYLISSASDNLGLIFGVVTWDDVTTASELKAKAQKYLQEEQFDNVVIECKAVDLHLTDSDIEKFKLLDMIRVKSSAHGLDRNMMITKMELNLNDPQKDTLTLGTSVKTSMSARTFKVNSEIMKKIEEIKPSEMLEQAKDNATQLIQTASNGFVTTKYDAQGRPTELLIMDTPSIETATKVWRWNVNGLGYSNTGYNGTYGLAMTMDGHFVADAITVEGLEVGKNVTMGEDAEISWEQVTSKPNDLAYTEDIPTTVAELTDSGDYATITYVDGEVPKKVSDLTDADLYALKTYVDGAFTELTPLYYLSTSKPSAPTSKVTSTATGANQWTTVLPTYVNGYYYWTCNQSTTKGGTTTWTPVVMYTQSDVVTKMTKDTVTTSYVNALNVTAGSVACENLTGTNITGKKFDGGSIQIGSNNQFKVDTNGNVTSKHLTVADIYSSGNVTFNATDTQNGGIYSNANISCAGNIVGRGTLDITKGATLRAGCTVTGVISATSTISSDAGLNANGTQGIYSGGNIYSAGTIATPNWSSASDRKLKQDIVDIPENDALALLNNMNPRYYKFKSDPETERTGFIAQEVLEVLENTGLDTSLFVQTITNPMTQESHYGLNYTDMVAILWKGWQKHEREIAELKAEIAEMKGE